MRPKPVGLLVGLVVIAASQAAAQVSLTFTSLPYQNFADPTGGLENAEVHSTVARLDLSFPFVLNENQTQLAVGLSWERRQFEYRGFPTDAPDIDAIHASALNLTLTHTISDRWSLLGIVTPGLASDLRGDLTIDDFNFQVVMAGIRRLSLRFAYGFGAAYSTQFGEPIPLPVLLFDWNNGRALSWLTVLPVSSEFWYAHSERFHVGVLLDVGGDKYQGDPARYGVDDPEMRYSVVTLGPSARVALFGGLVLHVDGGLVPYHRFEFYDGNTEEQSFNLESGAFLRIGLRFGG